LRERRESITNFARLNLASSHSQTLSFSEISVFRLFGCMIR
jgi:hypothetical protein